MEGIPPEDLRAHEAEKLGDGGPADKRAKQDGDGTQMPPQGMYPMGGMMPPMMPGMMPMMPMPGMPGFNPMGMMRPPNNMMMGGPRGPAANIRTRPPMLPTPPVGSGPVPPIGTMPGAPGPSASGPVPATFPAYNAPTVAGPIPPRAAAPAISGGGGVPTPALPAQGAVATMAPSGASTKIMHPDEDISLEERRAMFPKYSSRVAPGSSIGSGQTGMGSQGGAYPGIPMSGGFPPAVGMPPYRMPQPPSRF